MEAKYSHIYANIYRMIKANMKQRFFIFLFFLFISTLFWFLNTLSHDYTTTISYPVEYVGYPKNRHLVKSNKLPDKLQLTVTAFGFSLLRYNMSSIPLPISLNISNLKLNRIKGADTLKYFLLSNSIRSEISSQISSEFKIVSIQPDSLLFTFARMVTKKVAVKPDCHYKIAKQFMQTGDIVVYPDSVQVSGSHFILDTLRYIETRPITFNSLNQTFYGFVALSEPRDVILTSEKVLLQIPIERYTEAQIKIPVKIKNLPQNVELQIFPSIVTLRYHVALSNYSKFTPRDFEASVDYSEIATKQFLANPKLRIKINQAPAQISAIEYYPKYVDYLILK